MERNRRFASFRARIPGYWVPVMADWTGSASMEYMGRFTFPFQRARFWCFLAKRAETSLRNEFSMEFEVRSLSIQSMTS